MKRVLTQTFGVVGAILEKDGKFLLVKEQAPNYPDHGKWSHPAGWLEVGENPVEGVSREVKEESGYDFTPVYLLGVYSLVRGDVKGHFGVPPHGIKLIYIGKISKKAAALHDDISETKWFTPEEIESMDGKTLRDIDIKQMIKDYQAGQKYPLNTVKHSVQA